MSADQQVHLNGRLVTLDGLSLEVMRSMDEANHADCKAAFDRGYAGGRLWGHEERTKLREALAEAERFMAYFAGETESTFVGPGTPSTCLLTIRAALGKTG